MQTIRGLIALVIVAAAVFAFAAINDMKSQTKFATEANNATAAGPVGIAKKLPAKEAASAVNQVRQKAGHANL